MSTAVTSTLTLAPGRIAWTIRGWRGKATANAARRGKLRQRLGLLKTDGQDWSHLLAVATAQVSGDYPMRERLRHLAGAYRLTVEEWGSRARDLAAVIEASKRGVDALVSAGWLPGDGPAHLREIVARVGGPAGGPVGCRLTAEGLGGDEVPLQAARRKERAHVGMVLRAPESSEARPAGKGVATSRTPVGVAERGGDAGIVRI